MCFARRVMGSEGKVNCLSPLSKSVSMQGSLGAIELLRGNQMDEDWTQVGLGLTSKSRS